jgi:hypothetical protein
MVDALLAKYTVAFMAKMQKKVVPLSMSGYNTVEEDTNFGVMLHKEGLWSLYRFRDNRSLLYHLCRNQYGRFELKNNPVHPNSSECVECNKVAPDEIRGLWTLHNFEWVQTHECNT